MARLLSLSSLVMLGAGLLAIGCAPDVAPSGTRTPSRDEAEGAREPAKKGTTTAKAPPTSEQAAPAEIGEDAVQPTAIPCTTPADSVTSSYRIALVRAPDAAGIAFWVEQIEQGKERIDVLRAIFQGEEFATRKAALDDEAFVRSTYAEVLGREPDAEGIAFWLGALAGGMSRAEVAQRFADSPEFKDPAKNPAFRCYF